MVPTSIPPLGVPAQYSSAERPCAWCSKPIPIVIRPGRPRIYCRQSCRQRAYERRAGLGVLPPVDRRFVQPNPSIAAITRRPLAYEAGLTPAGERHHAMRPAARPDRFGRWPTLCGALAHPAGRPFTARHPAACATCTEVERLRPPGQPLAPSPSLAALRSILEDAGVWLERRDRALRGGWATERPPAPRAGTFAEVATMRRVLELLVAAA